MIYIALMLMTMLLVEVALALRIGDDIKGILTTSKEAMAVLAASSENDLAKELAARAGALAILRHTLQFTLRLIASLLAALIPYFVLTLATPISPDQFMETAVSWEVMVGLMVFGFTYVRLRHVRN